MAKDNDIEKVMVIGSGPIIIGQAAEFDYAGTQACKSLKEEGVKVILVNSNPATIMTDNNIADVVYIEPLNVETLEKIIEKEKPDGILPTLGGQTGLNLAFELHEKGILQKYNVKLLGTSIEAIKRAEDRELFKETMEKLNQPIPPSVIVKNIEEAISFAEDIGYPFIIRPAYTLGGTGGGIATCKEEFLEIVTKGLRLSMVGQVLIEKSVANWKEIEYEVMRDRNDNCITICNMENFDPVGIHTGDSIVVAPSQTLRDEEYQMLRSASIDIIRELEIEGGCNIQFALNPVSMAYIVIEVNPRVSRSSALASKATGYAIAKIAAKIAIGFTLDEIKNPVTGKTTALFEPTLDYVVVKIPQWPFDKFHSANRQLGTQMKATGEVMAIDRTFEAALLKAIRSIEGSYKKMFYEGIDDLLITDYVYKDLDKELRVPNDQRLYKIFHAMRMGNTVEEIHKLTKIDCWFLSKIKNIVHMEIKLKQRGFHEPTIQQAKKMGMSDFHVAKVLGATEEIICQYRQDKNLMPVYKLVDTCAGEFKSTTPYYYSTYEEECEVEVSSKKKVMILGSGPIRIGQGVEFDYCCVHGAWGFKEMGLETIIVNNNPETVSTDFDTSDKLYFEPLTAEDVLHIANKEKIDGVVVQFGGQTAINLVEPLRKNGLKILGTSAEAIDIAEDRDKFSKLLTQLNIPQTTGYTVQGLQEAMKASEKIGFPLMVRPSYVIGGQSMKIIRSQEELASYVITIDEFANGLALFVDEYVEGKEVEIDGISDGEDVFIPAIMEHIEKAGVHSGDSMSVYPAQSLSEKVVKDIINYTATIAKALQIKGLINIQYVIKDEKVIVLEANPRASRTVPIISKVTKVPMVALATQIMMGKTLQELGYSTGVGENPPYIVVKAPVFCLEKLGDVDTSLGPEMKSTGEVIGIGNTFEEAMLKAFEGTGVKIPTHGGVLLSIADRDKPSSLQLVKRLIEMGFSIYATKHTAGYYQKQQIPVMKVFKSREEIIKSFRDQDIVMVVNTPTSGNNIEGDGFQLRRTAVEHNIPSFTCLDTAYQFIGSIAYYKNYQYNVKKIS